MKEMTVGNLVKGVLAELRLKGRVAVKEKDLIEKLYENKDEFVDLFKNVEFQEFENEVWSKDIEEAVNLLEEFEVLKCFWNVRNTEREIFLKGDGNTAIVLAQSTPLDKQDEIKKLADKMYKREEERFFL